MLKCRHCQTPLEQLVVDLNMSPISNDYIKPEHVNAPEVTYPLKVYVCSACFLVQTQDFSRSDELFREDYAYFSSFSSSWLAHSKNYCEMISERLKLDNDSHVMEIASNDGYLLQYFNEKNIPNLGIEPCKSVADAAMAKGVKTLIDFFGTKLAKNLPKSDLICMCNVLAHVPDINDFVEALRMTLKEEGTITVEFPHLYNMIKYNQFDTIYHEHYSYLSLVFCQKLFASKGLRIYDVEEIPTHGGSLRIFACHDKASHQKSPQVDAVLGQEISLGLTNMASYAEYGEKVKTTKRNLLMMLCKIKAQGKSIVAYGAAAKGNTLFNYCGISTDFIDYCADLNPHKQNTYLPGSHIYVHSPEKIKETKPHYILITPWNIKEEIIKQLDYTKEWDCKFIVAIPQAEII